MMENRKKVYTFFWFIENYSYCWHEKGSSLVSPKFTINKLESTTWELELHPRGEDSESEGSISLALNRSDEDYGTPESISIKYELSFLAADGSTFCSRKHKDEFSRGDGCAYSDFLKLDKILMRKNSDYLPKDILTVRCKIWEDDGSAFSNEKAKVEGYGSGKFLQMDKLLLQSNSDYLPKDILTDRCKMWKEENALNIGQSSARSRIRIEKDSFLHVVENFSALQPNVKHTTKIPSHSKKQSFILSSLYFTEGLCCEEKIMIEIVPFDTNKILHKGEFFLLDVSGNVIECGGIDNRYGAKMKRICIIPLSFSKKSILNKKSEYLPGDKLSLICNCTFSSGLEFQSIEETINELSSDIIKKSNIAAASIKNYHSASEKMSTLSSVSEDMKSLYINQSLTDLEVKTKTKSFPAHKLVLCARSPVFKVMLTSDMKEKNTDCIHIDDFDDDIVQQLLLFLYSDTIENLQWENATRLYYAADKYQIDKLKEVCSSFLVENLTTTNAGELLLLSDTHSDNKLKKTVEDFILENEDEIFVSKEWDMIAEKNPLLGLKTMQLKYKRKHEVN